MSPEREYPGFHRFVQGCGVVLTLVFAALVFYDEPGFLKLDGFNVWLLLDAFVLISFLAVFVVFAEGGGLAFTFLISGNLAMGLEAIVDQGEMNGMFQSLATIWLVAGAIGSLVKAVRNRRLNKERVKLWGK